MSAVYAPVVPDPAIEVADRALVDKVLRNLDERGRSIVVLHYLLGLSLAEVATVLGIPIGTVKSQLHHALGAMRADATVSSHVAVAPGGNIA